MAFGRRWVAAAALVLLAGGCSDDEPDPEFQPPSESSAPTSPTDSPSSGAGREPWERKTEAGAVAFAKHWVDVLNAAGTSGEVEPVDRLSTRNCASCRNLIDYIDDVYRAGGRIESKGWEVREVGVAPGAASGQVNVTLRVHQALQKIHRPGEDVATVKPATFTVSVDALWDQRWMADRVEVIE